MLVISMQRLRRECFFRILDAGSFVDQIFKTMSLAGSPPPRMYLFWLCSVLIYNPSPLISSRWFSLGAANCCFLSFIVLFVAWKLSAVCLALMLLSVECSVASILSTCFVLLFIFAYTRKCGPVTLAVQSAILTVLLSFLKKSCAPILPRVLG